MTSRARVGHRNAPGSLDELGVSTPAAARRALSRALVGHVRRSRGRSVLRGPVADDYVLASPEPRSKTTSPSPRSATAVGHNTAPPTLPGASPGALDISLYSDPPKTSMPSAPRGRRSQQEAPSPGRAAHDDPKTRDGIDGHSTATIGRCGVGIALARARGCRCRSAQPCG